MTPSLILHIGMNKTGTTALQKFFNKNRGELARQGLLYPQTGCLGEAHHDLSAALDFRYQPHPDPTAQQQKRSSLKAALKAEIARTRPRVVVISSEFFTLPNDPGVARAFFEDWDTRILVYLRRHDTWWESAYAQATRSVPNPPWDSGPDAFIDWHRRGAAHFGNYRALLDRWTVAFGKDQIIVRPYEKQQNQPDLLTDFLTAAGAAQALKSIEHSMQSVNPSLPPRAVLLADLFQRLAIKPEAKQRLVTHALSLHLPGPHPPLLSPSARRSLVDEQLDNYCYIAQEYIGRADSQLFYDPLPDPGMPWEPNTLTPKQAVEEALGVIAADLFFPKEGSD